MNTELISIYDASRFRLGVMDLAREARQLALSNNKAELAEQFTFELVAKQCLSTTPMGEQMRESVVERANDLDKDGAFIKTPSYMLNDELIVGVWERENRVFRTKHQALMFGYTNRKAIEAEDIEAVSGLQSKIVDFLDALTQCSANRDEKIELLSTLGSEFNKVIENDELMKNVFQRAEQEWWRTHQAEVWRNAETQPMEYHDDDEPSAP